MSILKIEEEEAIVRMDKNAGIFEFSGKFLPQKTKEFYAPIVEFIEDYLKSPNQKTILTFRMDYFNTASSKKILDLMMMFESLSKQAMVEVCWYYQKDDSDIKEAGIGYSELVELPFKFIEM